ncbi:hypothetical protein Ahy_A02g009410 isoform H [Arachis hypogaea]|uniref:Uncharacterized protein n=1 Tax=Arachis hypogaea TaxID=3818 RepID=A0A445EH03_ARAHY|nr:hypothetical protein Ahy_A02g009410 isoform H [Arachis hypogaea]
MQNNLKHSFQHTSNSAYRRRGRKEGDGAVNTPQPSRETRRSEKEERQRELGASKRDGHQQIEHRRRWRSPSRQRRQQFRVANSSEQALDVEEKRIEKRANLPRAKTAHKSVSAGGDNTVYRKRRAPRWDGAGFLPPLGFGFAQ